MRVLPWLPDRLQDSLHGHVALNLSPQAKDSLCKALRSENIESATDLMNSLLLSETVYKVHDLGAKAAVSKLRDMQESFPPGLTDIQKVQSSLSHVHHRYLLASSPKTMYVSFIGTKLAKDVLVDANMLHRPLWKSHDAKQVLPAAHRGFLERSRRVPVERLLHQAQMQNKKLLLCGHSLGGAVANLCTLRVLQQAQDAGLPTPPVSCITFGTPAIGNSALAARVSQNGWKHHFQNVVMPEDLIPRLLAINPDVAPELEASLPASSQQAGQQPQQRSNRWGMGLAARKDPPAKLAPASWQDVAGSSAAAETSVLPVPNQAAGAEKVSTVDTKTASSSRAETLPGRLWSWVQGPNRMKQAESEQADIDVSTSGKRSSQALRPLQHFHAARAPARVAGALLSAGRMPLQQVWRRLPGQQEESVESLKAQSGEEDGAVEALVHSGSESGGQPTEAVAERRRGWLQRLAQLQNVAASAASTVGGMSNIMPTYIHFGQTVTWPALQPKDLPLDFESDIRSRILANHRMPAYRHRALTRIRAMVGLGPGGEHSCTAHLTKDLLPRAIVHSAVANFKPLLPPSPPSGTAPNRWSWVGSLPYMGNATSQNPSQTLEILVQGEALANINWGQVLANGSSWHPIRVLDTPVPAIEPVRRSLRRPGVLDWLRSQLQDEEAEPPLHGEAVIPMGLAAQVCQGQISKEGNGLTIHLRSDLEEIAHIPVQVRVPTVWLLGSSTAATRRLMASIGQQPLPAKAATAAHVTPAEVFVDGVKWCNLLAAPVTTPALALSALAYALPPNSGLEASAEKTGPLRMANQALQGLQAWLAGPHVNLREGASSSAIVLAVDAATPLPQGPLKKLMLQAGKAGVEFLTFDVSKQDGKSAEDAQSQAVVKSTGESPKSAEVLALRQQIYKALGGLQQSMPMAKL